MIARQFMAIFSLSLRRMMRSRWAYLGFAIVPLAVIMLILYFFPESEGLGSTKEKVNTAHQIYESLLRSYFLHFMVFFIANIFGFSIMRSEIDNQTLHYLFLQPINRWLLILGKLSAYLLISSVVCITTLWLCYTLLMLDWVGVGGLFEDLFKGGRGLILIKESLALSLGLLVYGALAMMMACIFKSNAGYGFLLLCWESLLPWLPIALKKGTIMHYLHSLMPERLIAQQQFFSLLGVPTSTFACFMILGCVLLITLVLAMVIYQFKECIYSDS